MLQYHLLLKGPYSAVRSIRGLQMKQLLRELRPFFPELLRRKRGGVIAACLAAAERTQTGQVELAKALAAAVRELPGNTQVYVQASGPFALNNKD